MPSVTVSPSPQAAVPAPVVSMYSLRPAIAPVLPRALFKQPLGPDTVHLQGRVARLYYETPLHRVYLTGTDQEQDRTVLIYAWRAGEWHCAWHPLTAPVTLAVLSFTDALKGYQP